jgi:drug/metabolite transporter (DMT)-like permease|tara:strand:- start:216 stop:881 length:666 start_codon:yes stop_codon:yes gene_type:complete
VSAFTRSNFDETDEARPTMSNNEVSRPRGVLIALGGVLAVSPDAMLLRWMRSLGASSPDVAVAKYIGIIVIMLVLGLYRGTGNALVSPAHFLLSAVCQLCYQLAFTFCLLLTDAATALLLISLAPLWAALLGVVTMGEPLPRRTVIALGLSVCSVGLVFMPRLFLEVEAPDRGPSGSRGLNSHGSLAGDLLALFTGLAQATSSATRTWPLAPALTGPPSPR